MSLTVLKSRSGMIISLLLLSLISCWNIARNTEDLIAESWILNIPQTNNGRHLALRIDLWHSSILPSHLIFTSVSVEESRRRSKSETSLLLSSRFTTGFEAWKCEDWLKENIFTMSYLCIVGVTQLGNIISRQSHFTNDGQGIIVDELPWHQDIAYALISISI